jgi:hypothetical protein
MAARLAALSTCGYTEAPAMIPNKRSDQGFCLEPPDGIEPSTYALRVRRSSRLS